MQVSRSMWGPHKDNVTTDGLARHFAWT